MSHSGWGSESRQRCSCPAGGAQRRDGVSEKMKWPLLVLGCETWIWSQKTRIWISDMPSLLTWWPWSVFPIFVLLTCNRLIVRTKWGNLYDSFWDWNASCKCKINVIVCEMSVKEKRKLTVIPVFEQSGPGRGGYWWKEMIKWDSDGFEFGTVGFEVNYRASTWKYPIAGGYKWIRIKAIKTWNEFPLGKPRSWLSDLTAPPPVSGGLSNWQAEHSLLHSHFSRKGWGGPRWPPVSWNPASFQTQFA